MGKAISALEGRTDEHGRIAFQNVDHTYASPSNIGDWTRPDPLGGLKRLGATDRRGGA